MAQETRAQCPACNTEILPGTLYCWQHSDEQRVAAYRVDAGQLLWATVKSKRVTERALALVIDGEQMEVLDAAPLMDQKPACLLLYYQDPGTNTPTNDHLTVEITMSELFERLLAGAEFVDATRSSKTA